MTSVAAMIASYVFNALWQIPVLALTGLLIGRLLRRVGPSVEHRVWVAILFASILLPASRPLRLPGLPHTATPADVFTSVHLLAFQPTESDQSASLILPATLIATVAVLYLAVWIFSLLRFLASLLAAADLVRCSRPCHLTRDFAKAWHEAKRFADRSDIRILSSSNVTGPVTLWLRNPILLLPERFTEGTSLEDFRAALAHECAHIRRKDYLKNLFYEGTSLFIAFHPATWWIKAQMAQTREMTCDAEAVEALGEPRVYVQSLLRLAGAVAACPSAATSHAIGIFDANILEKRIMTMRTKKQATSAALRYALVSVGSVCLFLAVTGGAAGAVGLSSERKIPAARTLQDQQVYKIGKDVSAPTLIKAADPEYSPAARKIGVKGTCLIALVVDVSGMPRDVHVVRSLSKDLDANAIKAVQQYRFKPAEHLGTPVPVALSVEVNFQIF